MSFLAPLFLVGLGALLVPVLLHLIQRERRNVVQFPSLMFLRRIPYQSVRRRRIRHWLLLAMRLAALTLIVLAFARPFLRRAEIPAGATGAREVVILLDRSYSMGYGDRWQRALSAARDAINGLGPSDRGSIVLFGSGAEVALRSTSDRGTAHGSGRRPAAGRRWDAVRPRAQARRQHPQRVAAAAPRGDPDHRFSARRLAGRRGRPAAGRRELTTKPVGDAETANLSVTPITLQRSTFSNQERVLVTGGVVNHGSAPVSGAELALEIGGRAIQTQRVNLEANGSASVTFEPVTLTERNVRASVRSPNDALARDNVFNFVISPEDPVRIIVAERAGAPRDVSLFLLRALAVGESPRFIVTPRQSDAISNEDLDLGLGGRPQRCRGQLDHGGSACPVRRARRRAARRARRARVVARSGRSAAGPSRARLSIARPATPRASAPSSTVIPCSRSSARRGAEILPRALLRLPRRDPWSGRADPRPVRRWRTGAAGAEDRHRPRVDVDVVGRHLLERLRA